MVSVEHPMRHPLLAALCDLDEPRACCRGCARRSRTRCSWPVPARRTRSATRWSARPSTATCCPASAARCTRGSPRRWTRDHELMGDAPAAAVAGMLACHWNAAHDVPRALGSSVAAGLAVQAGLRLQRGPAPLRARAGAVGPRARRRPSARAATASTCSATPPPPPRTRARPRGRWRSCAWRSPRSTSGPTRCAPPSCSSASATTCAGRARPRRASAPTSGAMALLPDGESPQRARLLEHHARGLMLRGPLRGGAPPAPSGARRDGRAAAVTRTSRAGALNTLGLSRAALGDDRAGPRAAAALARPRGRGSGRPSPTCRPSPTSARCWTSRGRTEEALAEVQACMEVTATRIPSARPTTPSWSCRASTT